VIGVCAITRSEQGSCTDDFALLVVVDCKAGRGELRGAPVPNFDEDQALLVEQDQVDFAATTTEVACDGLQASASEVAKRELFGVIA